MDLYKKSNIIVLISMQSKNENINMFAKRLGVPWCAIYNSLKELELLGIICKHKRHNRAVFVLTDLGVEIRDMLFQLNQKVGESIECRNDKETKNIQKQIWKVQSSIC